MYHIIYMFFSMNCNLCTTLEKNFNQIHTKRLFRTEANNISGFHKQGLSETHHQWKHYYNNLAIDQKSKTNSERRETMATTTNKDKL